jgi:acyl-CoA thioester hydrolase
MSAYVWPVRVYYEDTDAGGVVYYANYLKFMERARSEWLRSLGFEQAELMKAPGVVFVVRRVEVDYLKPARFNELLRVTVQISELRRSTITFVQTVENDAGVCIQGQVQVVCVSAEGFRPVSIPKEIREQIG